MKIYGLKQVEVVVDRRCDVCGASVLIDCDGARVEEVGELTASWGYGSKNDGISHHLDLCENCFHVALLALIDHRRGINMFDSELPDEDFGVRQSD
ncbi:hypothetical protein L4D09_09440 [Photobacterium makurazakiensis]|uniref:hypothetical protein n=1 Tax=Photobacterium makurazakiensis TaxID=2910234 RepID=UPI003D0A55FE